MADTLPYRGMIIQGPLGGALRGSETATATFTVVAYQSSYLKNGTEINYYGPQVTGGFRLKNIDNIDNLCLIRDWRYPNYRHPWISSGKAVYEFGPLSDINTMALVMGAKPGDTVKIYAEGIRRPDILHFATQTENDMYDPNKDKYVLSYPYKSWDYNFRGIESPYAIQLIAGFSDTFLTGQIIDDLELYDPRHPYYRVQNDRTVGGFYRDKIRPRKYRYESLTTNVVPLPWPGPSLLKGPIFNYYTDGSSDLPILYNTEGYSLDGSGWKDSSLKGSIYPYAVQPFSTYSVQSSNLKNYVFNRDNGSAAMLVVNPNTIQPTIIDSYSSASKVTYKGYETFFGSGGIYSMLVYMEKVSSGGPIINPPLATTTPTGTPTGTPAPTITASKTPTPTPTNTCTPTVTRTSTTTPSATRTETPTPTATFGMTPTPSNPAIIRGQLLPVRDTNNIGQKLYDDNIFYQAESMTSVGSVRTPYSIGKYEVTNYEYCEFLNAIGQNNSNAVYNNNMAIRQSGAPGSYLYTVDSGLENRPIRGLSWLSAARYCNWLHKNKPNDPTGNTINTGAYDLTQWDPNKTFNSPIKRSSGARYWIPSVHEWFKAVYYNPTTGGYYGSANKSNSIPEIGLTGNQSNAAVWNVPSAREQSVASFPNSVSYYGLVGTGGNIAELTDTWSTTASNRIIYLGNSYITNNQNYQGSYLVNNVGTIYTSPSSGLSYIGFRIASIEGLTEQEKQAVIPPPPTPTPILSCTLSSDNKPISFVNNQVCSHRFFVKNTPINNLYGGSSCTDPFTVSLPGGGSRSFPNDMYRLMAMGINFADRHKSDGSFLNDVREYTAESDLNSIARDMGAKPGDYVQLEVNYVWRGHSIHLREDGSLLADIIPYKSHNPFFGKDFFRKFVRGADPGRTDGWKNIKVDGAAPTSVGGAGLKTKYYGWDTNKNLLPADNYTGLIIVPNHKFGILNILEHDLDSITDVRLAYDPAYAEQYGTDALRSLLDILKGSQPMVSDTVFNFDFIAGPKPWRNIALKLIDGTSFNGNYKTLDTQKASKLGPLSTSLGFTVPVGDTYWLGLQDIFRYQDKNGYLYTYRSISQNTYNAIETVQYLFNNWLQSSPYGIVKKQIIDSLKTNIIETQKGIAISTANRDNTTLQNLNKKLLEQQKALIDIENAYGNMDLGMFTMLVKMTKQPPPPPPPSASPTPSLSRLGDINNQIFAKSPNYRSAFSDEIHLKQYIDNPFMTNLKSTTNDNGTPGLIPNTRYLINSVIEGRKVTYQNSSGYTIEQWKNNITTIKFNQPAQQQGNVIISFKLENDNTDRSYTVTVLKLKTVINTFSKDFWFGGSITNYSGDSLGSNSTYTKYIRDLSKYRFKAYYRVLSGPDKNTETWTPIGNDPKETTLSELGSFSNNYQSQILIRSNNLNNDILFPKEGTPANPGYTNDNPTFFTINVQSRSLELRSVGAGLKTPSSSVSEALKKVATGDNYTLNLHKDFNKLIELTVSCWSPTENKFVNLNGTSSQLKFSISNVTGCSPSAIAIDSENKIGYDNTNPNNGKVSLMLTGDPFNQQLFQKTTGTISVLCSISPSVQYQGATKTILLTWSILSQKDKITVSTIGSMYTGDPANLFTITLDSDVSSPKKIKTVTVSDNNILQLTNSGDSYSIKALSVDTTKASVLTALKSASIKVSVPGNSYWLPTETTIPLTVYPNNARLQRATPRKYAYLTSGLTHFLGITGDGSLHVWGTNINGVFASSITTTGVSDSRGLVNIINHPNGKRWIQVESYGYNVYAIDIDGDLWGWGANTNASLGVGRDGIINTPTRIASNLKWKDIACGISHAIGLTQDDKVYGWGDGTYLQNGCGTKTGSSVNVNVPTLIKDIGEATISGIDALRVSCGPYSSWIVDKNRNLWGFGDLNGMLTAQATYPISVKPGTLELNSMASPISELNKTATGYYSPLTHYTINYSTNILKNTSAKENIVFPIKDSRQYKWNPHKIKTAGSYTLLSNMQNISAGANHVMAVYTNNSLTSWGNNIWNQCWTTSPANKHYVYIGQSTLISSVLGDDGTFIATSPGQSIYIDKDNKLYAIGRNKDNELSALLGVIAPDWYTWPASQSSSYFQIPRVLPGKYISLTSNGSQSFIETAPAV